MTGKAEGTDTEYKALHAGAVSKFQISLQDIYKPQNLREKLAARLVGRHNSQRKLYLATAAACALAEFSAPENERRYWGDSFRFFIGFASLSGYPGAGK